MVNILSKVQWVTETQSSRTCSIKVKRGSQTKSYEGEQHIRKDQPQTNLMVK